MNFFTKYKYVPEAVVLGLLICGITFCVKQNDFWKLAFLYLPAYVIYFRINRNHFGIASYKLEHFWSYFWFAILLRALLVFAFPLLSNDVFRFIWDGRLLLEGYSPFANLPEFYLTGKNAVAGLDQSLFEAFDSKNTFSVYPPLAQLQFLTGVYLFPTNIYWSAVVMKLWLFLFETGTLVLILKLLKRFGLPISLCLLYALNPMILIEISGNLHFEGAMIFFLLLAWWLLVSGNSWGRLIFSALAFSLAIASKLLPLIFLPFLYKYLGWRKSLLYFTALGVITMLLFLPLLGESFFPNFGKSLNLYFLKLEFNASFYYLLRWIGFQFAGYNMIGIFGPLLGVLVFLIIIFLAFRIPSDSEWSKLAELWLAAICIYLLATTTLHPWYLSLPVVLCLFTRWRFPLIWSLLIYGTYINYSYNPYFENLWVVAMEYLILFGFFVYEWKTFREKKTSILR